MRLRLKHLLIVMPLAVPAAGVAAATSTVSAAKRVAAVSTKTTERKTTMTMCKAVQETPSLVRIYWGNNVKGASRPGELIGYGPEGCVIKFGGMYRLFAADAHQIGNALTELDWNKRKWELRSAYWCER